MRGMWWLTMLMACGGPSSTVQGPVPAPAVPQAAPVGDGFVPIALPTDPADKLSITATTGVRVGGKVSTLAFQALVRDGDVLGDDTWGLRLDREGRPLQGADTLPLCNGGDYGGLLPSPHGLFHVGHIECVPGAVYLTALDQADDGRLTATGTTSVDFSAVGGTMNPCAGMATPWGTHLGSEEYEPDARHVGDDGQLEGDAWGYGQMAAYAGGSMEGVDPYAYGWITEVTVTDPSGASTVVKHGAMGRFSHELAHVLPDRRTVYLADDGSDVGFFLFVADEPGKLDAGTLYAMRWVSMEDPTRAKVVWISLGHGTDAEIAAAVGTRQTRFDDLFEVATPTGATCPDGFGSVHTSMGHECLKVREGKELLASRLETRRVAALKGATTELRKGEGIAFDPVTEHLYYAISDIGQGMLDGHPEHDLGGSNHVRLPSNPCGGILDFELGGGVADTEGVPIGGLLVAKSAKVVWQGRPVDGDPRNRCDVERIANPDNLAFIPELRTLMVAEDTSRHEQAVLWAIDIEDGTHTRVLVSPWGGEVTGVQWYPDLGGYGYLTAVVQHPFTVRKMPAGIEVPADADGRTVQGYIGPFPLPLVAP